MKIWPDINQSVRIQKVTNGYILHVQCQIFIFPDIAEAVTQIIDYFADPQKKQEAYLAEYGVECEGQPILLRATTIATEMVADCNGETSPPA